MDALIADFDREVHNNTLSRRKEVEQRAEAYAPTTHAGVETSYYTNALITPSTHGVGKVYSP